MISPLAPGPEHPVYWALTRVLGLKKRDLSKLSRVSPRTLTAMEYGHVPEQHVVDKLRRVAERQLVLATKEAPRLSKLEEPYRKYYRAAHELVTAIVRSFSTRPTPVVTDLASLILANVGQRGEFKSQVIAMCRAGSSVSRPYAIKKCAKRIGIVEAVDPNGRLVWLPPPDVAPLARDPRPTAIPATTRRSRALRQALSDLLMADVRTPKPPQIAGEIVAALRARGYSSASIYRAARDARVLRVHSGFGASRQTTWQIVLRK